MLIRVIDLNLKAFVSALAIAVSLCGDLAGQTADTNQGVRIPLRIQHLSVSGVRWNPRNSTVIRSELLVPKLPPGGLLGILDSSRTLAKGSIRPFPDSTLVSLFWLAAVDTSTILRLSSRSQGQTKRDATREPVLNAEKFAAGAASLGYTSYVLSHTVTPEKMTTYIMRHGLTEQPAKAIAKAIMQRATSGFARAVMLVVAADGTAYVIMENLGFSSWLKVVTLIVIGIAVVMLYIFLRHRGYLQTNGNKKPTVTDSAT